MLGLGARTVRTRSNNLLPVANLLIDLASRNTSSIVSHKPEKHAILQYGNPLHAFREESLERRDDDSIPLQSSTPIAFDDSIIAGDF